MNKTELIKLIKDKTHLDSYCAKNLATYIIYTFKKDLLDGKGIHFKGVLTITPKTYKKHSIRNIHTKELMSLPEHKGYRLRLNKQLQKLLNQEDN